jgi:hypothetical protein
MPTDGVACHRETHANRRVSGGDTPSMTQNGARRVNVAVVSIARVASQMLKTKRIDEDPDHGDVRCRANERESGRNTATNREAPCAMQADEKKRGGPVAGNSCTGEDAGREGSDELIPIQAGRWRVNNRIFACPLRTFFL